MYKSAMAYIMVCGIVMSACSRQSHQPPQAAPIQHAVMRPASALVQQPASTTPTPAATAPAAQAPAAPAQTESQTTPKVVGSDHAEGPFPLGGQNFTFVKHVQSIAGKAPSSDSTVEWWEFRDAAGNAFYRQQYPVNLQNGTFQEAEDVDAREMKARFGQGILVEGEGLPSAPGSGWWVQVFGLMNGKLTPLCAPISADGEFIGEEVESYQPSPMFRGQQPQTISYDTLKFRMWTGNFNIFYGVTIDWIQGRVHPESTCYRMTSQGRVSACRYKVAADPARGKDLTFVRLFSEPDEAFTPKHVVIKPESKIDYIEAEVPVSWSEDQDNISFGVSNSSKVWLHIKIDGQDGWISGEEDFQAVGLSMAG